MRKALGIAGNILFALVALVLVLFLVGNVSQVIRRDRLGQATATTFGYALFPVASGSMSGYMETGDMVIVRDTGDYVLGDVITFYTEDGAYVTHRIVSVTADDSGQLCYKTKGDANNVEDVGYVYPAAIVGEVILVISGVGMFVTYLHTPVGIICLSGLIALLLAAALLFRLLRSEADEPEGQPEIAAEAEALPAPVREKREKREKAPKREKEKAPAPAGRSGGGRHSSPGRTRGQKRTRGGSHLRRK